ncbi:unnamed protein product [Kluyveromyces dobzhanskii CBS 2104]|uniref:GDP-Man:Man(3)GlcNAc(2)-PP-Dol alpha-1,2-mannosyltransferase n=1 Tax=Kluyveromyces dobzhanskii CBS 2104 TaxID=1427455 RepID=A0A0A8L999_9SACH|nr:unnamed protein product [Kluyveromyces dobzhanskii CBS 2104]
MTTASVVTNILGSLLAILVSLKLLTSFLPNLLVGLPTKIRLRANQSLLKCSKDLNKIPVLNFGWKNASARRAFVLASERPSDYTNKIYGDRVHIAYRDRIRRESFIGELGQPTERKLLGFFHPYCNAGGGGEKVLWKAVETSLKQSKDNICIIYTGDTDVNGSDILESVKNRFEYQLDSDRIIFIFLQKRDLVESKRWPRFTLLGQAYGSIILSIEALNKITPDYWIDTMGYPFAYPIVSLFANIPIVTYTHYPVISTDMLQKLKNMPGFKMNFKLIAKYVYWKSFMLAYKFAGSYVDIASVNSTWTYNHIKSIWSRSKKSHIIYPPCSTETLIEGCRNSDSSQRLNQAVVIAQFRPEKRHELILSSFSSFIKCTAEKELIPKLILIGSTRNSEDEQYVETLKEYAFGTLKIPAEFLEFKTDCKYEEMKKILYSSWFGINAMWNEHFGIAVVEYMASGLIPMCHASAGPLYDIVVPWDPKENKQSTDGALKTGFFFIDKSDPDYLAKDSSKYSTLSNLFTQVSKLGTSDRIEISNRGKICSLSKFSDVEFERSWNKILDELNSIGDVDIFG